MRLVGAQEGDDPPLSEPLDRGGELILGTFLEGHATVEDLAATAVVYETQLPTAQDVLEHTDNDVVVDVRGRVARSWS